ncbi:MAG TPA: multicopper oxidase family protein [Candidatus Hydrogenedentes bacterium]|nr:multicopper oxidase family protein [Candidatus Hydrogenedentota bacterium]HRK34759.1 multicopper oxidase family protein [Candidatus Hydrogenedentota bacterium]
MSISRRQFLKHSAGLVAAGTVFAGCPLADLIRTVEARRSVDGVLETDLCVCFANNRIDRTLLRSRTYEGKIPGPTLRVKPGDTLRLHVQNALPEEDDGHVHVHKGDHNHNIPGGFNITNFHSHGLHVSPKGISDNPYRKFMPGETNLVEIAIPADHPEGTFWYHPHHHGAVTVQLMGGMAGALIVEGDTDEVPEIADAREHILIIQELRINERGETPVIDEHTFHDGHHADFAGSVLKRTINGQVNPTIMMRPGEVQRWRFIQAGVEQFTPLALDDHPLHHIAMDGISFKKPQEVDSVLLSPGNRADVLVKAGAEGTYYLRKLAYNQGAGVVEEEILATVTVRGSLMDMPLPTGLPTPSSLVFIEDDEVETIRQVSFSVDGAGPGDMFPRFTINGQLFDHDRIDETVPLGAVEEWIITSATADEHPFHIHTHSFQVSEIENAPVRPKRWQDTVIVPGFGIVRVRIRFNDFVGKSVYHCHILTHEDLGMMANFKVVNKA